MNKKSSSELPEDITNRLRRIAALAGNEKAVDRDPVKVLSMLLYGLEMHASMSRRGGYRSLIEKYCSAEGIARYSRWLKEKMIA